MKHENNMKQGRAKRRLETHREMIDDLSALCTEYTYARKHMGKLPSAAYTGMPKGSPTPGRSLPEEEYMVLENIEARIRKKELKIREDWQELETMCLRIKPMQALIIKLRYHYGLEWKDVCKEIFGEAEDFEYDPKRYEDRMYKIHRQGIDALDTVFQEKFSRKRKKVSNPQ